MTLPTHRYRWAARCLAALVVFQLLIALLLYLNESEFVADMAGHSPLAPDRAAAEGSFVGGLAVHVVLAVVCGLLACFVPRGRAAARVGATVVCASVAVGGVAAMALPSQTYLSPVGVALAVAVVALLWWPVRSGPGARPGSPSPARRGSPPGR